MVARVSPRRDGGDARGGLTGARRMARFATRRRLGQILVEAGAISADNLEAGVARAKQTGERIGEALIELGVATRQDVLAALALQLELPFLFREEIPSTLPILKSLSPK